MDSLLALSASGISWQFAPGHPGPSVVCLALRPAPPVDVPSLLWFCYQVVAVSLTTVVHSGVNYSITRIENFRTVLPTLYPKIHFKSSGIFTVLAIDDRIILS